jgi:hypothetical protein
VSDLALAAAPPFLSLSELRQEHAELLRSLRRGDPSAAEVGRIEAFIRRGRATGATLEADADRWSVQSLLDYWATTLDRLGHGMPEAALADFDPELAPELDDSLCPFQGLDSFQPEQGGLFFGRERLVEQLLQRLRERRLLAIVGPSGSGKSSLVLAGVLPALRAGALPGSGEWRV